MNWRRPEIFSWRIYELWTEQWPDYRPHVERWLDTLAGRRWDVDEDTMLPKRNYVMRVMHVTMDLLTEGLRCFAYTLSHLIVIWAVWELVT